MKIKKIGHCCLLIETNGLIILTDPGVFTVAQNSITGIDIVLITHEHGDHLHTGSVQEIIKNNPHVQIITNTGVGKKLDGVGVAYTLVEGVNTIDVKNVLIEAFDGKHEEIFEEIGQVQNTGYFIDGKLFYPGDSYSNPGKKVDVLALPVGGPWCKIPDALRYCIEINPRVAFPVHDGLVKGELVKGTYVNPTAVLKEKGIEFVGLVDGEERDF
ncbi:MAG: MBL fold metallo-hydrolase [Patescibacteria group bacterium]